MKISKRFALILALVAIALGISVYIYASLFFRERLHVLIITLFLCSLCVFLGIIVTLPKMQAVSVGIMILGMIALGSSLYLLHAFQIHERAYTILGIGILCILGGLAGITTRSITTTLFGMIVLGMIALSIGFYLVGLDYHKRAYVVLGSGAFGILYGLIGIIITRNQSHTASDNS